MDPVLAFFVGCFVGGFIGIGITCLCILKYKLTGGEQEAREREAEV